MRFDLGLNFIQFDSIWTFLRNTALHRPMLILIKWGLIGDDKSEKTEHESLVDLDDRATSIVERSRTSISGSIRND